MQIDLNAVLKDAVGRHQAGDFTAAEAAYARILAVAPGHADANHLLGLIHHQQGRHRQASDLIRKAISCDAKVSLYHANLGRVCRAAGDEASAVAAFRDAVMLEPENAVLHSDLAAALVAQGDFDAARSRCHLALERDPQMAEAHLNLGLALQGLHGPASEEAEACFRRALASNAGLAGAHLGLGIVLHETGRDAEAAQAYEAALAMDPRSIEAHCNLGNLKRDRCDFAAAARHYRGALDVRPEQPDILGNLAVTLHEQGDLAAALSSYDQALALAPDNAEIRRNRAMALLAAGDFETGFAEYAWRWRTARFKKFRRDWTAPAWTGEALAGRRILIHAEQGNGDTIQFMRYLPILANAGGRVIFECPRPLLPLAREIGQLKTVSVYGERLPGHDIQAPLLDLPRLFRTRLDNVPADCPYLRVPMAARRKWAEFHRALPVGLKVGIAWRGSPDHPRDQIRSPGLAPFENLFRRTDCVFVSLQRDGGAAEVARLPSGTRLINPTDRIADFADTAALIEGLDLIISCDSAPAHLAGALGKTVWIALPLIAEWRWLSDRDDSPWYPTAKLFRQPDFGDWDAVATAMSATLAGVTATAARMS